MNRVKVLIVEDVDALSMIVKETLEGEGFEVMTAADGLEGLDAFSGFRPDVMIVDIMMPGMDGFELVRRIRGVDVEIPILFLTARSAVEDVVRGFELGANDYLRKPFSMLELIARIKALVVRSGRRLEMLSDTVIHLGAFRLDTTTQMLEGPGGAVELSNREVGILRMLMENVDNVVESREILMRFWGDDSVFNLRSLWVFITRLRQRLAADPAVRILNARGRGYKLVVPPASGR